MKAVVFDGIGSVKLEDVPQPKIQKPTDAIVQITSSAICGTDLHFVRGTFPGVKKGRILGHEAVGIVVETGKDVRNFRKGDRVVVKTAAGEVMIATLKRRTAKALELQPLDATQAERTMAAGDVAWVARIVWASQ